MDEKDLIRADADGYGEKCMDCVRGKPFCARKWRIRRKIAKMFRLGGIS